MAVVAVLLSFVLLLRSFLAAGTGVLPELSCAVLIAETEGLLSDVSELKSGRNRSLGSAVNTISSGLRVLSLDQPETDAEER